MTTLVKGATCAAALCSSLLESCISSNSFRQGKSIHHRIVASASPPDLHLSTKLVIFYARFGDVATARRVFDGMPHRSVVSWTAMVSGYSRNGRPREALELFALMRESGVRPNQFTYGSAASACAGAGCARSGEQVHACAARGRFAGDMFVQSALMGMHLWCGSVADARRLFAAMERRLVRGFASRRTSGRRGQPARCEWWGGPGSDVRAARARSRIQWDVGVRSPSSPARVRLTLMQ